MMRQPLAVLGLFFMLASVLIPMALWIYQSFQFGGLAWDLARMEPSRIVATTAKALVLSVIATTGIVVLRSRAIGRR